MLTEREIQETRGIGCGQLRRMRLHGVGPRFIKVAGTLGRVGGKILYPVKDLDAWIATLPTGGGPAAEPGATPAAAPAPIAAPSDRIRSAKPSRKNERFEAKAAEMRARMATDAEGAKA